AALHHSAPLVPLLLGLLLALDLEQTTAQDLHRFRAVLDLAALVLALDRDAARDVRDLHRAVGRVHALTARAAGRGDIDFQIALVDLEVDLLRLGQHGDGRRGGVDAPLRFRLGDPLHAVHAALVLEPGVHAIPAAERDRFLPATGGGLARAQDFHAPAAALRVAGVHAKEVRGEQRGFLAAGAGAHLEDRVPIVVRVARQEQDAELVLEPRAFRLEPRDLLARERAELGVVERFAVVGQRALDELQPAHRLDDRQELPALAVQRVQALRIGEHPRVTEELLHLLVPTHQRSELVERQHLRPTRFARGARRNPRSAPDRRGSGARDPARGRA